MAASFRTWSRFNRLKFTVKIRDGCRSMHSNPWTDKAKYSGQVEIDVGNRPLKIETGNLARFADGSAVVQHGDTSVLVTAVSRSRPTPASFLPLTVDYRQKAAAAGRIPTNYLRRELGPSEKEILTSRLIDRSLRPIFPSGYFCDTQIMCNLLVVDGYNDPDVLSINAASAALALSDIPWNGPVAAVRVGYIDDQFVINPTRTELHKSDLNLVISCAENEKIVMLEASAKELPTDAFKSAIEEGVKNTQSIIEQIKDLQSRLGKEKRTYEPTSPVSDELLEAARSIMSTKITEVFQDESHDKFSRDKEVQNVKKEAIMSLKESYSDTEVTILNEACDINIKQIFRDLVIDTDKRCDGRTLTDLRPISCNIDLYKPLHGSALFQRGQTQVLCTCTFDSLDSASKPDLISQITGGVKEKNFMLHYEFPPYATNETARPGVLNRRELGHGALAEKGLIPVIPSDYPFTIRLTSEVLESNGSSSMASVCGGSLALMDAGVPINNPAAGVAIGLISRMDEFNPDEISDYRILTDILGIEDYMGDMDFKMAGTKDGVTALQADIKLAGLPKNIVFEAVDRATDARNGILEIMAKTISAPNVKRKEYGPVTEHIEIPLTKRGKFLGVGGFNLKKLTTTTGVRISSDSEMKYQLFAPNQAAMDEAKQMIDDIITDPPIPTLEFGAIYKVKIVEIKDNGVMVQLHPGLQSEFIHLSQLDAKKVNHTSALDLTLGQHIPVKYFGRDPVKGNMRLSKKVLHSLSSAAMKDLNIK